MSAITLNRDRIAGLVAIALQILDELPIGQNVTAEWDSTVSVDVDAETAELTELTLTITPMHDITQILDEDCHKETL